LFVDLGGFGLLCRVVKENPAVALAADETTPHDRLALYPWHADPIDSGNWADNELLVENYRDMGAGGEGNAVAKCGAPNVMQFRQTRETASEGWRRAE
jgi:hypothetical protein